MRHTKQRNGSRKGRVEVTAEGALVVFGDGNSFSLSKDQLDAVLSLNVGTELETETFQVRRLVEAPPLMPDKDAIRIYVLEEGPMWRHLMIVSRRGLQRAARLAQEQT